MSGLTADIHHLHTMLVEEVGYGAHREVIGVFIVYLVVGSLGENIPEIWVFKD